MNTLPVIQITDNSICCYQEIVNRSNRSALQKENESNLKDVTYKGYMSPKTKSKVRKYLGTWLNGIELNMKGAKQRLLNKSIYPTFITLTLSAKQNHEDNEIKRQLLNPFIIWLNKSHQVRLYYWRAEPQKNGNIHFHIIVDRYIPYLAIRSKWNQLQSKLGYIETYSKQMQLLSLNDYYLRFFKPRKKSFKSAEISYLAGKKSNWCNPNSSDIHKIEKINNLSNYIIKYMTKTEGARKIEGRIHGGSDLLKQLKPYSQLMGQAEYAIIDKLWKETKLKRKEGEFFTVWYLNTKDYLKKHFFRYKCEIEAYYLHQFSLIYSKQKVSSVVNQLKESIVEKVIEVKKKAYHDSQKELFA